METARWTFTPNDYFYGTVNLSYNVTDGTGSTAVNNTFSLAAVNDAPELTGAPVTLSNGTEDDEEYIIYESDLLAGYTDAEDDQLSTLGVSATNGVISSLQNDGTYKFTPNENFNGEVTLHYVVADSNGGNVVARNLV